MIRVAGDMIHRFEKNELGDQLEYATLEIWSKIHGLSATAKLIEHAIFDANEEGDGGIAIAKSDISYAVGMLSDYASMIASQISRIGETISIDEVKSALNKMDANHTIIGSDFGTRAKTYKEEHAKEKTA